MLNTMYVMQLAVCTTNQITPLARPLHTSTHLAMCGWALHALAAHRNSQHLRVLQGTWLCATPAAPMPPWNAAPLNARNACLHTSRVRTHADRYHSLQPLATHRAAPGQPPCQLQQDQAGARTACYGHGTRCAFTPENRQGRLIWQGETTPLLARTDCSQPLCWASTDLGPQNHGGQPGCWWGLHAANHNPQKMACSCRSPRQPRPPSPKHWHA